MNQGLFPALGNAAARYRWFIVVLWLVLAGASVPAIIQVPSALKSPVIEVPERESGQAAQILETEFDRAPTRTAIAVFTSPTRKATDDAYRQAVEAALQRVRELKGVHAARSFYDTNNPRFIGSDERTSYAVITFTGTAEEAKDQIPAVRTALLGPDGLGPDLNVQLTGFPAFAQDLEHDSQKDAKKVEIASIPVTLALLLLVFGTVLAAGLPVILGSVAVMITLMLVFVVARQTDVSIFAMNTATVLGMGLGIDFSLMMVFRFREELARDLSPHQAAVRTVATSGQAIVFSGLTVILGISVLMVYDLVDIRSIALAMMIVVAIAVLAAITLLPAMLVIFGKRINALNVIPWRRRTVRAAGSGGRWHAWSMAVMRRPWLFLIASLLILGALAWPAREMRPFGSGGFRGISPEAESRQAYETLIGAFPAGETGPISVVISTNRTNGAWDDQIKEAVFQLTEDLRADPRVARVDSIATLQPNMTLDQVLAIGPDAVARNPGLTAAVRQYINTDRGADVHVVQVIPKTDELAVDSVALVEDLRERILPRLRGLRDVEVRVTGQTALTLDYHDKLWGRLPVVIGLVLLVTFVVLLLFFHSLLLPLKAILMNVASLFASYGMLVMVFQWGIMDKLLGFDHLGFVSTISPVILLAVLFGLSTDYEVFLLSRVKELYKTGHSNEESVAEGLERTAGLITAAGVIMLTVFGGFALANVVVMKEIGVGVAAAILLDTTIVRVVLVPATMKLMGSVNWWMPKFLDWIPEVSERGGEAPIAEARPVGRAQITCSTCGRPLPPRARFCGHCGTHLSQPAPSPAPGKTQVRAAEAPTALRPVAEPWSPQTYTVGQAEREVQLRRQAADAAAVASTIPLGPPPSHTPPGTRLVPVVMIIDGVRRRDWIYLRDCQVEIDPRSERSPSIAIDGLVIDQLPGRDPPQIQVVNAKIKF